MKTFSIITNFGCNKTCHFCIFKNHRLKNNKNMINFKYLNTCFDKYASLGGAKISISGGGDPLYSIDEFYNVLMGISNLGKKKGLKVDIHTNESLLDKISYLKKMYLSQVVMSTHTIDSIRKKEAEKILEFSNVRLVLLYIDQSSSFIENWINFYQKFKRLTIRQCRGMQTNFEKIKDTYENKYPNVCFLKDGDYNYYLMPDNKVYDDYEATILSKEFKK